MPSARNLWPNQHVYQRVAPKTAPNPNKHLNIKYVLVVNFTPPLFLDDLLSRRFPLCSLPCPVGGTAPWWPLLLSGSYFTLNAPPLVVETLPSTPPAHNTPKLCALRSFSGVVKGTRPCNQGELRECILENMRARSLNSAAGRGGAAKKQNRTTAL